MTSFHVWLGDDNWRPRGEGGIFICSKDTREEAEDVMFQLIHLLDDNGRMHTNIFLVQNGEILLPRQEWAERFRKES